MVIRQPRLSISKRAEMKTDLWLNGLLYLMGLLHVTGEFRIWPQNKSAVAQRHIGTNAKP